MRRLLRTRPLAVFATLTLLLGFALALVRGDNVSERIPSREELQRNMMGDLPPEPTSLADFLSQGSHLGVPRTVAIATVGGLVRQNPEVILPRTGPTPAPRGPGPTADYLLQVEDVLSPSSLRAGDAVTLRRGGPGDPDIFTPFPHPRDGERLLLVLVSDHNGEAGVYRSYPYGTANISGPRAHLADVWRTSVRVMGVPESTPAFIEAVRTALAARP